MVTIVKVLVNMASEIGGVGVPTAPDGVWNTASVLSGESETSVDSEGLLLELVAAVLGVVPGLGDVESEEPALVPNRVVEVVDTDRMGGVEPCQGDDGEGRRKSLEALLSGHHRHSYRCRYRCVAYVRTGGRCIVNGLGFCTPHVRILPPDCFPSRTTCRGRWKAKQLPHDSGRPCCRAPCLPSQSARQRNSGGQDRWYAGTAPRASQLSVS